MTDFKSQGKLLDMNDVVAKSPLALIGLLGGLASCTAEIFTFPLDNVKTRMQMNGKDGLPNYKGLVDCIKQTFSNQGIPGFYRGISASMLRQFPYSTVRIFTYESIKRYFTADVQEVSYMRKLTAGGIAGAVGCIVGTPGDVLKVRMINDLSKTKYKGLVDCAQQTIQTDGAAGFLKGLGINVARAVIVNACELATYDTFKGIFVKKFDLDQDKLMTHFLASTGAGFVAAFCSSPVDVLKTRYMNQLKGDQIYRNTYQCAVSIFQNEGPLAFYKGFTPYFLRITPWTIIMFVTYEKYKYLFLPRYLNY